MSLLLSSFCVNSRWWYWKLHLLQRARSLPNWIQLFFWISRCSHCWNSLLILNGVQDVQRRSWRLTPSHWCEGVSAPTVRRLTKVRTLQHLPTHRSKQMQRISLETRVRGFGFLCPFVGVALRVLWSSLCSYDRNTNSLLHGGCRHVCPVSNLSWIKIRIWNFKQIQPNSKIKWTDITCIKWKLH